jgi:hypothetical protein
MAWAYDAERTCATAPERDPAKRISVGGERSRAITVLERRFGSTGANCAPAVFSQRIMVHHAMIDAQACRMAT